MGCHPSHWRTPSFFKMVKTTNQNILMSFSEPKELLRATAHGLFPETVMPGISKPGWTNTGPREVSPKWWCHVLLSMDWFKGQLKPESPFFHGKIYRLVRWWSWSTRWALSPLCALWCGRVIVILIVWDQQNISSILERRKIGAISQLAQLAWIWSLARPREGTPCGGMEKKKNTVVHWMSVLALQLFW